VILRLNPSSGVPVYLQIVEQIKHSIEIGALEEGDQLPGIRPLAEDLVVSPNTVVKAYNELERDGVIRLRHGAGAYVSESNSPNSRRWRIKGAFLSRFGKRNKTNTKFGEEMIHVGTS
jgi:GntR family transcriptional regulator